MPENSARALLESEHDEGEPKEDLDSDVKKIQDKIAERLAIFEDMIKPRRFILISSTSQFLNYFEYLVMVLAIWNAIWTPLTIAFD